MFTGIVERMGTIVEARAVAGGRRLRVDAGPIAAESVPGASIAVDGVCLTATELAAPHVSFDVIHETLTRTTLGSLRSGDRVNLERSLRAGDRLDGHFVQGHVDGTAEVVRVESTARECLIFLAPQPHLVPFIIPKGSVTVCGVSLTIAGVSGAVFSVALIPTTLERTTLGSLSAGRMVNMESDILARTIVHHLGHIQQAGGLTLDSLQRAGFA